jgi:hypothetical protein
LYCLNFDFDFSWMNVVNDLLNRNVRAKENKCGNGKHLIRRISSKLIFRSS